MLVQYCFDTSALNALHDEPAADKIGNALIKAASVRVTVLNIIEVCKTTNIERRISLLKFLRILTDGKKPLGVPNDILINLCVCYRDKLPSATITIDDTASGLWRVLQRPDVANDNEKLVELKKWTDEIERPILNNARAREEFQRIFESGKARPRSASALIRHYNTSDDFIFEFLAPMYQRATDEQLPPNEVRTFLESIPHWATYLASWAYLVYGRSVRVERYSGKFNPGMVDLWNSVYLPLCDVFVTNDWNQYKALRLVNRFNRSPNTTQVRYYSYFRKMLIS